MAVWRSSDQLGGVIREGELEGIPRRAGIGVYLADIREIIAGIFGVVRELNAVNLTRAKAKSRYRV